MEIEKEWVSTTEALQICKDKKTIFLSLPSIINWTKTYKLGVKVGGRWRIDKKKLTNMLEKGNVDEKTKAII